VYKGIISVTESLRQLDSVNFSRYMTRHGAIERLNAALEEAQKQQGRFYSDISAQRCFWKSICRTALNQGRDVIVDLPAQGPVGVAIARIWDVIERDARLLEANQPGEIKRRVRLRRLLIHSDEDHPLVERFKRSAAEGDLFVGNMIRGSRVDTRKEKYIPIAAIGDPVRRTVISNLCEDWDKLRVDAMALNNSVRSAHSGLSSNEKPPQMVVPESRASFDDYVAGISATLFELNT
jgi:hypothetical protein